MTTLAFVVLILGVLAGGFGIFRTLRWPDEVDEGRVLSDGIRRTDATRARLRGEQ